MADVEPHKGAVGILQERIEREQARGHLDRRIDPFPVRRLAAEGLEAWAEVQGRGLEGLVAKPEASRYVPGARGVWRKVKVRREGVFILAGIAKDRDGYMMLVVGVREGRALRVAGTVSLGVTRGVVAGLYPVLEPLVRAPSPTR